MRALFAAWLLVASLVLPGHAHGADAGTATLGATCGVCVAAHQIASAAPAPVVPDVAKFGHEAPLAPDATLPAPLDAPARLSRAPPLDPANA